MPNTIKRGQSIATIDAALIVITPEDVEGATDIALDTASTVSVEVQTETTDAIQLIVKGKLIAQKGEVVTITGHQITMTDNVFTPELAKIVQGGEIEYDGVTHKFKKYTPPTVDSGEKGQFFTTTIYSPQYDSSGKILAYEKVTYPHCQGQPFGIGAEDNTFFVAEYTINSAPGQGESPYTMEMVESLPEVTGTFDGTESE